MPDNLTFYAEDAEGFLRRWRPSAATMAGEAMARAIQGTSSSAPDLLEFLAGRLVEVHGESPDVDFIKAARQRAIDLRHALPRRES